MIICFLEITEVNVVDMLIKLMLESFDKNKRFYIY